MPPLHGHPPRVKGRDRERRSLFQRSRGCQSLRLERSIEQPDTYKLLIGWATLEDHTVHFRESPELQKFRSLAGGYVAAPAHVERVRLVLAWFGAVAGT